VLDATLRKMREQTERQIAEQEAALRVLERELARHAAAMKKVIAAGEQGSSTADQILALQQKIEAAQAKAAEANAKIAELRNQVVDPIEVTAALASFAPVWG